MIIGGNMFVVVAILILVFYAILDYKKPGIALVTSPIVCLLLLFGATLKDTFWGVIFAPVIFITTLLMI